LISHRASFERGIKMKHDDFLKWLERHRLLQRLSWREHYSRIVCGHCPRNI